MASLFNDSYRQISHKVINFVLGDELRKAEAEAQSRLNEQIALREASTIITSTLDLSQVLSKIAEQLCHVADSTSVYIVNLNILTKQAEVIGEFISDQANEAERESDLGVVYEVTDTRYLEAMEAGDPWVDTVDDPDLP